MRKRLLPGLLSIILSAVMTVPTLAYEGTIPNETGVERALGKDETLELREYNIEYHGPFKDQNDIEEYNSDYSSKDDLTEDNEVDDNLWTKHASSSFSGGDGSAEHPYEISNGQELAHLAVLLNQNRYEKTDFPENQHYILTNDIDLSGYYWDPIGFCREGSYGYPSNTTIPLAGVFDGKGHTISNMQIKTSLIPVTYAGGKDDVMFSNNVGLFAYTAGTVKNIKITDAEIYCDCITTAIGFVAGESQGIISNCSVSGEIRSTAKGFSEGDENFSVSSDTGSIGGIVGNLSDGIVNDCYADVDVIVRRSEPGETHGSNYIGGIVGYAEAFSKKLSQEEIDEGYSYYGEDRDTEIRNCVFRGKIQNGFDKIGGIAGQATGSCYNDGRVRYTKIANCISDGEINNDCFVPDSLATYQGGIVGEGGAALIICDVLNLSSVTAVNVGGIIAGNTYCELPEGHYTINRSVNLGNIISKPHESGFRRESCAIASGFFSVPTFKHKVFNDIKYYDCCAEVILLHDTSYDYKNDIKAITKEELSDLHEKWSGWRKYGNISIPISKVSDESFLKGIDLDAYKQMDNTKVKLVRYYENGGDDETSDVHVRLGDEHEIESISLFSFDDRYGFIEWNTKADGTGTAYKERQKVKITGHLSLYAQWKVSEDGYIIKFDGNKATKGEVDDQFIEIDKTEKLSLNRFKRTGYKFKGWNTKANGKGKSYKDGEKVKNLAKGGKSVTLYAQWMPIKYKIKFNANGGKGKMSVVKNVSYGKNKTLPKNTFTKKGYKFAGWAKSKNNAKKGKVAFKNKSKVKNLATKSGKTITLYAVWKKNKIQ